MSKLCLYGLILLTATTTHSQNYDYEYNLNDQLLYPPAVSPTNKPKIIKANVHSNLTLECSDDCDMQRSHVKWQFKPCSSDIKTAPCEKFYDYAYHAGNRDRWIKVHLKHSKISKCSCDLDILNVSKSSSGLYRYIINNKTKRVYEIIGFSVVGMVCDLGGGNRSLHKELNVSAEKTWFKNPSNEHKIYVFADVPHLMKLIRNHFVDNGFILNNKKEINKNVIEELLEVTSTSDLTIAHKISRESLNVKNAGRQKVKLATKLFSHTISSAISRCGMNGQLQSENWMECAEFFKMVNDWFDCLNVRIPEPDSRERTKAYGLSIVGQNNIINQMTSVVKNMTVKGRKTLLPFQTVPEAINNDDKASKIVINPKNITVPTNTELVIRCSVNNPSSIMWFKETDINGYDLMYDGHYYSKLSSTVYPNHVLESTEYQSKLSIRKVTLSDSGVYVCVGVNEDSIKTEVNIVTVIGYSWEPHTSFSLLFLIPLGFALVPITVWLCYYRKKRKENDRQRTKLMLKSRNYLASNV